MVHCVYSSDKPRAMTATLLLLLLLL